MGLNHVYKVIWSKTKHCYVVVSELAKRVGRNKVKAAVVQTGTVAAVLAVTALTGSVAQAALNDPGTGSGAVAWGTGSQSTTTDSVAIGKGAKAENANAIAIGGASKSSGDSGIALGNQAKAENKNTVAIGRESKASGDSNIALGYQATANKNFAIAIGKGASASQQNNAVAIGANSQANGATSVALGMGSKATGNDSYAIGYGSESIGGTSIAFGNNSKARKDHDIVFGREANTRDQGSGYSIAIGYGAMSGTNNGGKNLNGGDAGGVAIGTGAYTGVNKTNISLNSSVAVGAGAGAGYRKVDTDGLPTDNATDADTNANVLVKAFGGTTGNLAYFNNAGNANKDGFFSFQNVNINEATALGRNARAIGDQSVAIGAQSVAGQGSIVIGGNDIQAYDGKKYFKAANPTKGPATTVNDYDAETTPGTGNDGKEITITNKYKELVGDKLDNTYRSSYGQDGSTVIGMQAHSTTPLGVAIGTNSIVRKGAFGATAIGSGASVFANAEAAVAIGMGSKAQGNYAVAAGTAASAKESAVAAGYHAEAELKAVALGNKSVSKESAVAVGDSSKAAASSVAVGQLAKAEKVADIAVGQGAVASGEQGAIAMGLGTNAQGDSSIMIGGSDVVSASKQTTTFEKAIGIDQPGGIIAKTVTEKVNGHAVQRNYTFAATKTTTGTVADAFLELTGRTMDVSKLNFGDPNNKNGHASTSLGVHSLAKGDLAAAIGASARADAIGSLALGTGAHATLQNAVAIGTGSTTELLGTRQLSVNYNSNGEIVSDDSKDIAYTFKWAGGTNTSEGDVVSFGSPGAERQLKNVAAGRVAEDSTDAINGSQLNSITKKIAAGFDASGNLVTGSSGVFTSKKAGADSTKKDYLTSVRSEDKIQFQVGNNLKLDRDETESEIEVPDDFDKNKKVKKKIRRAEFAYSLNPELTNLKSAQFKNDAGDTTVINGAGVTVTPVTAGKQAVSLTTNGLNNGGNAISNVANNLPSTTNSTTANTKADPSNATKVQAAPNTTNTAGNNYVNPNNAATVGDVLNAGWNLQGNSTAVDFVKPYDTVDFVNGDGTTASVTSTDGKTSTIKYSVNLGNGLQKDDTGNTISVKPADKSLEVDNNGVKVKVDGTTIKTGNTGLTVNTGTINNVTTGNTAGTVVAKTGDENKIATVGNVVTAINNAAWTATSAATNAGELGKNATNQLVKAGDKVTFEADKNIKITQNAGKFTFATRDDVSFNTVQVGGSEGPKFAKADDGSLKVSDKDGTEPVKITNVKAGDISKTSTDAINGSQFHAVAKNKIKLAGQNGTAKATETDEQALDQTGGIKFTVKSSDGALLDVAAADDTITLTPKTGTITTGTDGVPTANTTDGKLVTADQLVTALTKMGWKATAGQDGTGTVDGNTEELIKAGNTVTFKAGNNLAIKQEGKNFIYSLQRTLSGLTSAEFKDANNNTVNITPTGITITKPADTATNTPAKTVKLNQDGLDNGGNPITNVTSNLVNYTDPNVNGKAPVRNGLRNFDNNAVPDTNAATVGDIRNMGWVVSSNKTTGANGAVTTDEYSDTVKNANEVKFVGEGSAIVSGKTDGNVRTITVKVDNQTGLNKTVTPVNYTKADGTKVYPQEVDNGDGTKSVKFYPNPDGTGTEIPSSEVITSVNGPKGTKTPTTLSNVEGNLAGAKTNTTAPTTNAAAPNTTNATGDNYVNPHNAATVGDVLNAGWNLQNNGTEKDFVKPYDTVNFVDGDGTTAVVETTTDQTTSKIKYNVNTGNGLEKTTDNKITVKPADSSLVVDAAGVKVNTGAINKVETGNKAGTVVAKTGDESKIATVSNVVEAINNAAWTATSAATSAGELGKDATNQLVKAGDKVTFEADKNIKITQDAGKFTFATKDNVSFNTVQIGDAQGPKFSKNADGDIKVSGSDDTAPVKITNVKDGDISANSKDAINGSQFHKLANNTITLQGQTGEAAKSSTKAQNLDTKDGIKFTVKSSDGSLLEVTAAEDTITLTPKTGTITTGADGIPTANITGGKLVTAEDLVTALKEMGWKATSGSEGTGTATGTAATLVKAGDTVTFKAGDNLAVKQDGKNFIYSLNPTLTGLTSAEFKDDKNNTVNITPTGITITKPADPAGTTGNTVTLNQNGLNNGGNAITNVAGNLPNTKNNDAKTGLSNATISQAAPTLGTGTGEVNKNNAATVGDVLNAGWNLQGNGAAVDFVKPYDTVNFVNGVNTTAVVSTVDGVTSNVTYNVTGLPITYTDKDGNLVSKIGDKFYKVNDKGQPLDEHGNPSTKVNNNGEPVDGNGNVINAIDTSTNPVKTSLVNPIPGTGNTGTSSPTTLDNVTSKLTNYNDAPVNGNTPARNSLVDLSKPSDGSTPKVSDNTVATVGDLRNMGWIVSSDKKTDDLTKEYSDTVKNANEVKFVGEGAAIVSGKTENNVRTITVKVDDQTSTNNAVTPVVYTDENGNQVYPTGKIGTDGNQIFNTKPDGKGDTVTGPVKTTVNGPKGTTTPTTVSNVEGNLDGAKTGTTAPTDKHGTPNTTNATGPNYVNTHNAATVGDVLQAGWNLQNNGTAKDFVKPYDTVNFVNGGNTVAVVTTSDDGTTSNVTFNVVGLPVATVVNTENGPVHLTKVGDNYYPVNGDGTPNIHTNTDGNPTNGYVKANDGNYYPAGNVTFTKDPVTGATTITPAAAAKPVTLGNTLTNPNVSNTNVEPNKSVSTPTSLTNVKHNLDQVDDGSEVITKPDGTVVPKKADKANITHGSISAADAAKLVNPKLENGKVNPDYIGNNAATIGDVLNAGWNLQGNGKAVDFVKPYDTVNFRDGGNTTVSVTTDDNLTSHVQVNVTGLPVTNTITDANGKEVPVVKVGDTFYPAKPDGTPDIQKGHDGNPTNGYVQANDGKVYPRDAVTITKNPDDTTTVTPNTGATPTTVHTNLVNPNVANTTGNPGNNVNTPNQLGNVANGAKTFESVAADGTKLVQVGDKFYPADKVQNGALKPGTDPTADAKDPVKLANDGKWYKASEVEPNGKPKDGATAVDNPLAPKNATGDVLEKGNDGKWYKANELTNGEPNNGATVQQPVAKPANSEKSGLIDFTNSNPNNAATIGDLQNMGWVVSAEGNSYADQVRNANEVKFVGEGTATVTGKTVDGVRTITVKVDDQTSTNKSVTPVVYTDKDGNQVYPTGKKDNNGNQIFNTQPDGKGNTVTGPVKTTINGPKGTTSPTSLSNVKNNVPSVNDEDKKVYDTDGNLVAGKNNTVAPITAGDAANLLKPTVNGAANPKFVGNNAATVSDVLNAGWNLQNNGAAKDFVKPYDTVNFVNGINTTAVVTTSDDGTTSNVTYNVTGLPVTYTTADGTPVSKIGDKYYKVNEQGQPLDANGKPATKINENGVPVGADGQPIPDVNITDNPLTSKLVNPNATNSTTEPNKKTTDPTQLGNVTSGLNKYGDQVNGAEVTGTNDKNRGLVDLSKPTTGEPKVSDNTAATVGDLRNMGWIVSSNKTTGANGAVTTDEYSATVKNANEVRFVGEGTAVVSGKTEGNVRTITVKVDDQVSTNNSVTPVNYTKADGTKVYPKMVTNPTTGKEELTFFENPDGSGAEVPKGDVITSINGPEGTTSPTTLKNVKNNIPNVNDGTQEITKPDGTIVAKTPDQANINKAPLTAEQAAELANPKTKDGQPNPNYIGNNAATVSDVLNAGWNLQGNGVAKDFVKPYDTVNFVNGVNTTALVTTSEDGTTSNITYNVTGLPVTYTTADGTPVSKIGDKYYKVNDQGQPVDADGNPVTKFNKDGVPVNAAGQPIPEVDITTNPLTTSVVNPKADAGKTGTTTPTRLSNVEGNLDGAKTGTNAPTTNHAGVDTTTPTAANYVNPHNAATVGDVLNAGWNLQGNSQAIDFVRPYDTVNFINGANTTAVVTTNTEGTASNVTFNVTGLPMTYTTADGTPVSKIGDKFYKVNDKGQPVDANGKPSTKVNNNGEPLDENGVVIQPINTETNPLHSTLVNPNVSNSDAEPNKQTTSPTQLGNVTSGLHKFGDTVDGNTVPGTTTANTGLLDLSTPTDGTKPKVSDNTAATVGDLRNMGWIVSSDKTTNDDGTAGGTNYTDQVRNANEVKFVGKGTAIVSGKTVNGVRTITVKVDDQVSTNNAIMPTSFTTKDGKKVYPVKDDAGNVTYHTTPDGKGAGDTTIDPSNVVTSVNGPGPNGTTTPTTLQNVKSNLPNVDDKKQKAFNPDGTEVTETGTTTNTGNAKAPLSHTVVASMMSPYMTNDNGEFIDANGNITTDPTKYVRNPNFAANNAATVSDVLNAGWNLQNNGTAKDFVKPYDTVNFINGRGTTAVVTTREGNTTSDVTFNVKPANGSVTVDEDGVKVTTGEITSNTNGSVAGPTDSATAKQLKDALDTAVKELATAKDALKTAEKALEANPTDATLKQDVEAKKADVAAKQTPVEAAQKAHDDAGLNKIATVQNVADAINNAGFNLKTSEADGGKKLTTGTKNDGELIKPGNTVEMVAGKNLTVKQDANGKITYATKDDVTFTNVNTGTLNVGSPNTYTDGKGNTYTKVGENYYNPADVENGAPKPGVTPATIPADVVMKPVSPVTMKTEAAKPATNNGTDAQPSSALNITSKDGKPTQITGVGSTLNTNVVKTNPEGTAPKPGAAPGTTPKTEDAHLVDLKGTDAAPVNKNAAATVGDLQNMGWVVSTKDGNGYKDVVKNANVVDFKGGNGIEITGNTLADGTREITVGIKEGEVTNKVTITHGDGTKTDAVKIGDNYYKVDKDGKPIGFDKDENGKPAGTPLTLDPKDKVTNAGAGFVTGNTVANAIQDSGWNIGKANISDVKKSDGTAVDFNKEAKVYDTVNPNDDVKFVDGANANVSMVTVDALNKDGTKKATTFVKVDVNRDLKIDSLTTGGTVVDKNGNNLVKVGDDYYKESDIDPVTKQPKADAKPVPPAKDGKDLVKVGDKYYEESDIDPVTKQPKANAKPVSPAKDGEMIVKNADGKDVVSATVGKDGSGVFGVNGKDGKDGVSITAKDGEGAIGVNGKDGKNTSITGDSISIKDKDNKNSTEIGINSVTLKDKDGNTSTLTADKSELTDKDGNKNTSTSTTITLADKDKNTNTSTAVGTTYTDKDTNTTTVGPKEIVLRDKDGNNTSKLTNNDLLLNTKDPNTGVEKTSHMSGDKISFTTTDEIEKDSKGNPVIDPKTNQPKIKNPGNSTEYTNEGLKVIPNSTVARDANGNPTFLDKTGKPVMKDTDGKYKYVGQDGKPGKEYTGGSGSLKPNVVDTTRVISFGMDKPVLDANGNPVKGPDGKTVMTEGISAGMQQIHNVAPGTKDTDAVNVSQLKGMANVVMNVNNRVNRVGAQAAALAGLQSLQYDPLEPTQISAGLGYYKGAGALALGVNHFKNESTMFHMGASFNGRGDETMMNASVTWKFGARADETAVKDTFRQGPISASYTLQDKVSALEAQNQIQKDQLNELRATNAAQKAENEAQREELALMKAQIAELFKRMNG